MAYKKKDLEKLSLEAIEEHNLVFIDDVVSYLPCSESTFYNHKLEQLDSIKSAITKNKVATKADLRRKMLGSEAPAAWIALYKLIGTEEEAHRLNGSKQQTDLNIKGNLDVNLQSAIDKIYDGDGENSKGDD
jgi:hypothetical protein